MSLNRIVVLLTPVFSAAAAVGSAWLAKHGLQASPGQIEAAEIAGATAAIGGALSWLKGHQAWEKRVAEEYPQLETDLKGIASTVKKLDPKLAGEVEVIAQAEITKAFAAVGRQAARGEGKAAPDSPGGEVA
jgi:hypothetical protein